MRRIQGITIEGWQRVAGELSMEKTFQSVNSDSIHLFPEMIISDSCIARFERYISFEMGTNLQNPAFRWELGVPIKLATRCPEEMVRRITCALRCPEFLHQITIAWAIRLLGRASRQINREYYCLFDILC
ncbi:hypothetical protein OIU79_016668 [Salix purpurea]|uniref:Uncharacterized protein n=1 Tax=Salix purpurea TaxID=77065 RepID=A0A9Q0SRS1_SALPP|nr:hypothetical protein OIU79_016668 [Salix purpurea]